MKTRYFKSGILAAAAALLYSAAFVSCTDDVTVGEWDGAGSIETGLNETGAVLQDLNSGKSNTTVELWKETYTAELRLVLTKAPAEGFTARAKFDTSYDAGQYNKANGTDYTLYPADKVTFANDGLFAAAGRNVELTVEMTVEAAEGLRSRRRDPQGEPLFLRGEGYDLDAYLLQGRRPAEGLPVLRGQRRQSAQRPDVRT